MITFSPNSSAPASARADENPRLTVLAATLQPTSCRPQPVRSHTATGLEDIDLPVIEHGAVSARQLDDQFRSLRAAGGASRTLGATPLGELINDTHALLCGQRINLGEHQPILARQPGKSRDALHPAIAAASRSRVSSSRATRPGSSGIFNLPGETGPRPLGILPVCKALVQSRRRGIARPGIPPPHPLTCGFSPLSHAAEGGDDRSLACAVAAALVA